MSNITRFVTASLMAGPFILGLHGAYAEETNALDTRQKKIIPIAAFTAIGDMARLESALNDGLEAGLTVNEVKELLVHAYAYAGFPRALNGITTFMDVLDKRKAQGIEDEAGNEATPVPDGFDRNAYGHQTRNALVGRDLSTRTSGYAAFAPIIDEFLVEHLFADIFYRDVLDHQERELATISMLSAMEGTEAQLKAHFGVSMNVGITPAQLTGFVALLREKVGEERAERAGTVLNEVLGIDPPERCDESVKVIKNDSATTGSSKNFTGQVTVESRFSSPTPGGYGGGMVHFEAGARTAWHTHPRGQTLIIISGRGLLQAEGDAVQEMLPGDVVQIPAMRRHWHGAAPDSPMSHIAISQPKDGMTVEWMEHVAP